MSEFIQCAPAGLLAIYEDGTMVNDGVHRRRKQETMPIVGYLKDEKGDLTAAVLGNGGKVVVAASIKGFCGVKWADRQQVIDIQSGGFPGDSLFDRFFGRKNW